jgi:hypothetical protein
MNDQMHDGKGHIHRSVAELGLLIPHGNEGNSAFDDPKDQHAAYQESEALTGTVLETVKKLYN